MNRGKQSSSSLYFTIHSGTGIFCGCFALSIILLWRFCQEKTPVGLVYESLNSRMRCQVLEWSLTALSLLGCWFNIQKSVVGWIIWSFANVGWILSFMAKGMMAESTLFVVYLGLSIYGTIKWSRSAKQSKDQDYEC